MNWRWNCGLVRAGKKKQAASTWGGVDSRPEVAPLGNP